MDTQKQEVAERIKQSNNILLTVSNNPSVDQLAACIGLTLALNKMGKHATAVFSGAVPSTIEFLQPEKTIEKNTDSLRDFIIALDKSKADKLRYKVEDKVVKIFITPYKTSISDKDLEFSQGDFNVDVVLALGVHDQADLDQAITAHGRILHDATVMTINLRPGGELGSVNWLVPTASSLSELAAQLMDVLDKRLIDNQIATAFLTGIVAETDRFSNEKTSPQTMSVSAELMAAGANQQLVATKLEEPVPPPVPQPEPFKQEGEQQPEPPVKRTDDGTLEITHDEKEKAEEAEQKPEETAEKPAEDKAQTPHEEPKEVEKPVPQPEPEDTNTPKIHIDENGSLQSFDKPKDNNSKEPEEKLPKPAHEHTGGPRLILNPPTFDKPMSAEAVPGGLPAESSMTLPQVEPAGPLLSREPLQRPSVAHTITPPSEEQPKEAERPTFTPTPEPFQPTPEIKPIGAPLSDIGHAAPSSQLATPADNPLPQPSFSPAPLAMPEPDLTLPPAQPTPALTPPSHPGYMTTPPASQPPADAPSPEDDERPSSAPTAPPSDSSDLNSARDAVTQAINASPVSSHLEPIEALNAQSLGGPLHNAGVAPTPEPNTAFNLPGTSGLTDQATPVPQSVNNTPIPNYAGGDLPQPSFSPAPPASSGPMPNSGGISVVPPVSPDDNVNGGMPPASGPGTPPPVPPPMLPPMQP